MPMPGPKDPEKFACTAPPGDNSTSAVGNCETAPESPDPTATLPLPLPCLRPPEHRRWFAEPATLAAGEVVLLLVVGVRLVFLAREVG